MSEYAFLTIHIGQRFHLLPISIHPWFGLCQMMNYKMAMHVGFPYPNRQGLYYAQLEHQKVFAPQCNTHLDCKIFGIALASFVQQKLYTLLNVHYLSD